MTLFQLECMDELHIRTLALSDGTKVGFCRKNDKNQKMLAEIKKIVEGAAGSFSIDGEEDGVLHFSYWCPYT